MVRENRGIYCFLAPSWVLLIIALAPRNMAARAPPHKRTAVEFQRQEARGENTRNSASCRVGWIQSFSLLLKLKALCREGCRVQGTGCFVLSLLNPTQPWKLLNAPLSSAVALIQAGSSLSP